MERTSTETVVPDSRDETSGTCEIHQHLVEYVIKNSTSTNTRLFSFLVLLNAYIPESYLLMPECKQILGPPDPIHGGPPFEKRMEPFTAYINTSSTGRVHVRMINPEFAQTALELLGISKSATVKEFMSKLCEDQPQPYILRFIKELLTKRKLGVKDKDKFSRLIEDIRKKEIYEAVSVLKTASDILSQDPSIPQAISRLYHTRRGSTSNGEAEKWAKKAIERAPNNSYMADTLGQVYKNRLREAIKEEDIVGMAQEAFKAFKDVEMKADKEEGPQMTDTAGTVSISNTFNNRGLFGFIQVATIAFEKLKAVKQQELILTRKMEVEDKFDFFEWYLTYSKLGMTSVEPGFFWKDVVLCYKDYTQTAAESTSFAGLLDCLNRGLFVSKGRRAGFEEAEKTVSDLEAIRDDLKTTYHANIDDDEAAERYILSNIILSNKMHDSPQLTPVRELQRIIHRFLGTEVERRSSEFYLLVLLLFWPEEQPQVVQKEDDEEVEQHATEADRSEDREDQDRDEEQETRGEPAQLSLDLMFDPDLQQQVEFMKKAFERAKYAKYLRGRYLLPLFFLGKGSGLSKWIHKSRLDAIVEEKVDAELADKYERRKKKKLRRINEMWVEGEVWQVPEIKDILHPVRVELCPSPTMPHEEQRVFVCAGGKKIMVTTEVKTDASGLKPRLFYLGFTIQGPVVFTCLDSDSQ